MAKIKNLKHQFIRAIDVNTPFLNGVNASKYDAKQDGTFSKHDVVYSYADHKNIVSVAKQISEYIKFNYSDVKYVKDIQPEHLQKFLDDKKYYCRQSTLESYGSYIKKLETLSNKLYKTSINWTDNILVPESLVGDKIRVIAYTKEDIQKIDSVIGDAQKYTYIDNKSVIAWEFCKIWGLRVSEATSLKPQDFNFTTMQLRVKGKGGRVRYLEIKEEHLGLIKESFKGVNNDERICNIKNDSVNKWLSRMEKRAGITTYNDAKTGIHALRKYYAQCEFDKYRAMGLSIKDAFGQVCLKLGHGANRNELMEIYITNIH